MNDGPDPDLARGSSFDELVREGVSLIPAYAPAWTNYNPSDPGITLVELLAYFSEILAYRGLRITPDAKLHFLRLLEGRTASATDPLAGAPSVTVDAAIRARVEDLSRRECAVTPGDFEQLATHAAAAHRHGRRACVRSACRSGICAARSARCTRWRPMRRPMSASCWRSIRHCRARRAMRFVGMSKRRSRRAAC